MQLLAAYRLCFPLLRKETLHVICTARSKRNITLVQSR